MHESAQSRVWLAGATGLIGGEVLELLRAEPRVAVVHALARRPAAGDDRVAWHGWDWLEQPESGCDVAICCLGTTLRQAGSRAAFAAVDRDLVLRFAEVAKGAGARGFALVSSVGASTAARSYYLRIKGETEQALQALGFDALHFLRPSLLLGKRAESRPMEDLAQRLAPVTAPILRGRLARYRPIPARQVAEQLCAAALSDATGCQVHYPGEAQ